MARAYIPRSLERPLRRAAAEFPAVVLTGPRQSGKTTLLRRLFGGTHRYVSLEAPDVRMAAERDPRGFLEFHPPPVVFDEVQRAPGLLPYIQERVDAERRSAGRFLLTGSQDLLLLRGITETLAGRAAILRLLPLSRREIAGTPDAPLPWERRTANGAGRPARQRAGAAANRASRGPGARDLWKGFLRGGYPELVSQPGRDPLLWHRSYVQTYLERDVRSVRQIADLTQFQAFLRALAARSGQLLNMADVARDLGVAVNTIRAWISVLEATCQVTILRPYFANVGKRLVKTPKIYFSDVGILAYLTGLEDPLHAAQGPLAGPLLETAVVSEVLRTITHRGREPRVYFWRTSAGAEVDLVVEHRGCLVPVEVKCTATPSPAHAAGIAEFRRLFPGKAARGFVVHTGRERLPLGPDAVAHPFREL